MKLWKSWKNVPTEIKILLPEACLLLILLSIALLLLPYKVLIRYLKYQPDKNPQSPNYHVPSPNSPEAHVARAISICSRRLVPWAKCLPQAMAADIMLSRREIQSHLFVGVFLQKDGKLGSHAWLCSGRVFVTGLEGSHGTEQIICYRKTHSGDLPS